VLRRLLCALALAAWGPAVATAEDQPVVVELFTSQGCSSCPPADRFLHEMSDHPDVLALALHVDYWDYIGWKDSFADPRFTKRQKAYAHAGGEKMIYTPQVIVGGEARTVGSRVAQVADAIMAEKGDPQPARVAVSRDGGTLSIRVQMAEGAAARPMLVQLVSFTPHERVAIHDGENAGRVMDYANIVRDWQVLGEWDGTGTWTGEAAVNGPAAVIVQAPGPGEILGARRVE